MADRQGAAGPDRQTHGDESRRHNDPDRAESSGVARLSPGRRDCPGRRSGACSDAASPTPVRGSLAGLSVEANAMAPLLAMW